MPDLMDSMSIDLGSGDCLDSEHMLLSLSVPPCPIFTSGKGGGGGAFVEFCGIGGGGGGGGNEGTGAGPVDGGGGLDGIGL